MHSASHELARLLNVEVPLIQGGMTWVSRHPLAVAVAEAGAVGVIGAGGMDDQQLRDEIRALRALTARPFAVNVPLINLHPDSDEDVSARCLEVVCEEEVPLVITGAGSPAVWTARLQEMGARVLHVVPSPALAVKCEAAGVDVVIAESHDGGGHVRAGGLSTFTLVPQVVDAVSIPVIAAGGIADARGVAAALALGAHGVQVGTRFIGTTECNAHPTFKQLLVDAGPEQTVIYSTGHHASRALKTPAVQTMIEMELGGAAPDEVQAFRGRGRARAGCIDGNSKEGILPAGGATGLVKELKPAAAIVRELARGFEASR